MSNAIKYLIEVLDFRRDRKTVQQLVLERVSQIDFEIFFFTSGSLFFLIW